MLLSSLTLTGQAMSMIHIQHCTAFASKHTTGISLFPKTIASEMQLEHVNSISVHSNFLMIYQETYHWNRHGNAHLGLRVNRSVVSKYWIVAFETRGCVVRFYKIFFFMLDKVFLKFRCFFAWEIFILDLVPSIT